MATQNLPNIGQQNWGDILNKYLSVSTDEKGSIYTFVDEAERDTYFDGSTIHKTLDEGKTCIIKSTGQIQKYNEGTTTWESTFDAKAAGTDGQVQFNDSGSFGASADLHWDKTNGRLGVGTNSPEYNLDVNDSTRLAKYFAFGSDYISINDTTFHTLTHPNGEPLNPDWQYRITMVTRGTSTDTGVVYLLWYYDPSTAWQIRKVSDRQPTGTNNPVIFLDSDIPKVKLLSNTTLYNVVVQTEARYFGQDEAGAHVWGSDYGWARNFNDLSYLEGSVGIGTETPSEKLDVAGSIKITDGNQGAGKILTSDASGVASWQNPTRSIGVQTLTCTGTSQTINWDNGAIVKLNVTGATGNVALTLQNPTNGDYVMEITQGSTARDIIFPTGTIQGNGITGRTVYSFPNSIQIITILYDGSKYVINVDVYA